MTWDHWRPFARLPQTQTSQTTEKFLLHDFQSNQRKWHFVADIEYGFNCHKIQAKITTHKTDQNLKSKNKNAKKSKKYFVFIIRLLEKVKWLTNPFVAMFNCLRYIYIVIFIIISDTFNHKVSIQTKNHHLFYLIHFRLTELETVRINFRLILILYKANILA